MGRRDKDLVMGEANIVGISSAGKCCAYLKSESLRGSESPQLQALSTPSTREDQGDISSFYPPLYFDEVTESHCPADLQCP